MDAMRMMERLGWIQHMRVDAELRSVLEAVFLAAVEAIDSCRHARKPVKKRDGILWVRELGIQRQADLLFENFMAFTDTPVGIFFMDVAFPGYADRRKACSQ
jgi:hypothetical protein